MSTGEERIEIPRLEGYDCFGCGTENPIGLGMTFYVRGGQVCSDVVLDRHRVGWQGMAHGGLVATLLDEVMAWTVLYFKESFCVTRAMRARYHKPVPVGVPVTACGELLEGKRRFACRARGTLVDGEGTLLAESEGDFALLGEGELRLLPEALREGSDQFMEGLRRIKAGTT